jgi:Spy/CpxP family protein refolding chaperone
MRISLKPLSAQLGALALASIVSVAAAAQSHGATPPDTILGPASARSGSADLACGPGPAGLGAWGVDRIEPSLGFTDDQRTKFNDLKEASRKALQYLKESCPTDDAVTASARLDTMERRLEAMLEAVRTVKPALVAFYSSLSDEQKARLNALDPTMFADRGEPAEHSHRVYYRRRHWGFRLPIPIPF